jgi:hypothetical protein
MLKMGTHRHCKEIQKIVVLVHAGPVGQPSKKFIGQAGKG